MKIGLEFSFLCLLNGWRVTYKKDNEQYYVITFIFLPIFIQRCI